ncbi:MAG: hypothetical protein RL266_458 [Bacteroidota bacterium]
MDFKLPFIGLAGLFFGIALIFVIRLLKKHAISVWFALPILAGFIPVAYVDRHLSSLPAAMIWSPFLLVVVSAFIVLLSKRAIPNISKRLIAFYFALFLVSIVSALVNDRHLLDVAYVHRGFYVLFSMAIILSRSRNRINTEQLHSMIVWLGVLTDFVAFIQRIVLVTVLRLGSGDMVSGFFGTDGEFLFFQLTCLIIILSYWFHGKKLNGISNGWALTIIFASIAIANNKAAWGFVAMIFLAFGFFSGFKVMWKNFGRMIVIMALAVAGYTVFDAVYVASYQRSYKTEAGIASYLGDPEFMSDYLFGTGYKGTMFTKGGALKRGAALTFAYDHLQENEHCLIIGMGPASTTKFTFGDELGFFERRFPGYKVGKTSLSMYWAELGVAGVLMLVTLAMVIYFGSTQDKDQRNKLISRIVALLFIVYLAYDSLLQEISVMLIIAIILNPIPYSTQGKVKDGMIGNNAVKLEA